MEWLYYVIGGSLLAIAVIAIAIIVFCHKYAVEIFKRQVWHKLYRLVQDQDFYLLNQVTIKTESNKLHIDHLVVGDKFIYVIAARSYEDNLVGTSYSVPKWQVKDKDGTLIREISNPVAYNENRTMYLAKFLGWNNTKTPMFISLVVINNGISCTIDDQTISQYSYIIHKKDVNKLIKKVEKETNLPPFDDQALEKIISRIHRLSSEIHKKEENFEEQDNCK